MRGCIWLLLLQEEFNGNKCWNSALLITNSDLMGQNHVAIIVEVQFIGVQQSLLNQS
jgi:hypothetical protein